MKNKNQAEKLLAHSEALLTVIEDHVKKINNTDSIERILLTPEKTEYTKPQNKINEEDREIIISLLNEGYKSTEIIELFPEGKYTWQQIATLKSSLNTQESDAVLQAPN